MTTLSIISSCATKSCSFNQDGCTAYAITVGGTGPTANCTTFAVLDARAGAVSDSGRVGACKRLECTHNTNLLCTAEQVSIGGDTADCLSYQVN